MINMAAFSALASQLLDFVGIMVILLGVILSTIYVLGKFLQGVRLPEVYRLYRWNLARSILIGLEFLVAADIIRSVGGQLTFNSVILLAIIVLVRAFLSMQFEMELEGRWPWRVKNAKASK